MLVERLRAELMESKGLPLHWFDVLIQLSRVDEQRMSMHELAESVVLSKSGVTRLVDRMVDAGLVERMVCESDRRITYAALTEKGRATLEDALPVHMDGVRRLFERHLNNEEKQALISAFTKILDAPAARPSERRAAG